MWPGINFVCQISRKKVFFIFLIIPTYLYKWKKLVQLNSSRLLRPHKKNTFLYRTRRLDRKCYCTVHLLKEVNEDWNKRRHERATKSRLRFSTKRRALNRKLRFSEEELFDFLASIYKRDTILQLHVCTLRDEKFVLCRRRDKEKNVIVLSEILRS